MMGPTIRREPVRPPAPPPSPMDAIVARLARDGVRPTRAAILRAALADGHDPEFAELLARRAGGADD